MLPSNKIMRANILSVCIFALLSMDVFISDLPENAKHFAGHNVAAIFGISLLAVSVESPIFGVFLDGFGRKPTMLAGLILFSRVIVDVVIPVFAFCNRQDSANPWSVGVCHRCVSDCA